MSPPRFLRLHATLDLLRRHGAVLRQAWASRCELDGPRRLAHEAAFLPAALELQETPPSPAPRAIASGAGVYAAIKADLTRAIILAERANMEADKAHERISNHVEQHHTTERATP